MSGTTFANSSSSFRASQSHVPSYSSTDNPLTQLPSVDFNFEELRQRMAAFTVKFDAFIQKGQKRVLEERNEFRGRLAELGGMYTFSYNSRCISLQIYMLAKPKNTTVRHPAGFSMPARSGHHLKGPAPNGTAVVKPHGTNRRAGPRHQATTACRLLPA
jgi:hypothetical protein